MGYWRGVAGFVVVVALMLAAAAWLIRETPSLLDSAPEPSSDGDAPPQPTPEPPATAGPIAEDPPADQPPVAQDAIDAAAIEAAVEIAARSEAVVTVSAEQACAGLGGTWRDDSRGWCDLPLPSAAPVSDTAVLHPQMLVPCPQPLERILEQVVEGTIGGDEMRIYLLYRSVDDDLEELSVGDDPSADIGLIVDGLRRVEADMRERAVLQRDDLAADSFLPMQQRPTAGEIGSGFGMRVHPVTGYWSQHNGADMRGDTGDPVIAVLDGEVLSAQFCPFYGNTVVVYHGAGLATVYAHLDSFAVGPDDGVAAGTLLGAMGSTGRATGPHLHFEARVDGVAIDPVPFIPAGTAE